MARFQPEKWKPWDDSTEGFRTVDPTRVVLFRPYEEYPGTTPRAACPCGCGEFPSGDRAIFRMGHDARLRGILIRAHLMGVEIAYATKWGAEKGDLHIGTAEEVAESYHWKSYLDAAVLKREGRNREVLRRALKTDRLVRVGRWEYTGQVVAVFREEGKDMFRIEYVNQAGEVKTMKVPAEDAPVAAPEELVS